MLGVFEFEDFIYQIDLFNKWGFLELDRKIGFN